MISSADADRRMTDHYANAAEIEPENVKYQWSLAQYQWAAMSRSVDPQTRAIRLRTEDYAQLPAVVSRLLEATRVCPTYGPAYALAGEMKVFALGDSTGRDLIRTAYRLSPCNPTAVFAAGRLDAAENRWDECVAKFRRYTSMTGFGPVLNTLLNEAGRPDLAFDIAKGDRGRSEQLAAALRDGWDQFAELASQVEVEADRLLTSEAESIDAKADVLAIAARKAEDRRDPAAAEKYYRRALQQEYGRVEWRFALANCLAGTGNVKGAAEQARLCLSLRPQMAEAKKLLADLSVRRPAPVEAAQVGG
jgi:hypothetical protein